MPFKMDTTKADFSDIYHKDVSIGDVFVYQGKYYMKTEELKDAGSRPVNTVELSTGNMFRFTAEYPIQPVRTKLVRGE